MILCQTADKIENNKSRCVRILYFIFSKSNYIVSFIFLTFFYNNLYNFFIYKNLFFLISSFTAFVVSLSLLLQKKAKSLDFSFKSVFITSGPIILPYFFVFYGYKGVSFFSFIMCLLGLFLSFSGALFILNNWGVLPARREIVTRGAYRFVRHPMYLGYIIFLTGMVFSYLSLLNVILFILFVSFLVYRIKLEENILRKDKLYEDYMTSVRWRLFPYLF